MGFTKTFQKKSSKSQQRPAEQSNLPKVQISNAQVPTDEKVLAEHRVSEQAQAQIVNQNQSRSNKAITDEPGDRRKKNKKSKKSKKEVTSKTHNEATSPINIKSNPISQKSILNTKKQFESNQNQESHPDWLHVYHEKKISMLCVTSELILSCDLSGACQDYSLIVTDLGADFNSPKIRNFSSLECIKSVPIIGIPVSIIKFQQATTSKEPLIAVAVQDEIFIYRNFKAYYRWKVNKSMESKEEAKFQISEEKIFWEHAEDHNALEEALLTLEFSELSKKSKLFLTSTSQKKFLQNYPGTKMPSNSVAITCLTTMKRDKLNDDSSVDIIIIGDDQKNLYFLDTDAFSPLSLMSRENDNQLPDVPTLIQVDPNSLYESNFTVYFIGRNSQDLFLVKRYKNSSNKFIWQKIDVNLSGSVKLTDFAVISLNIINQGQNIVVLTTNGMKILGFVDGKISIKTVKFDASRRPIGLEILQIASEAIMGISFSDGFIEFYHSNRLARTTKEPPILVGTFDQFSKKKLGSNKLQTVKFLPYGREETSMIAIFNNELYIKILKRTSNFHKITSGESIGSEVARQISKMTNKNKKDVLDIKLPSHTQLFIEILSQQESYMEVHKEMAKMKLLASESYLNALDMKLIQAESRVNNVNSNSIVNNLQEDNKIAKFSATTEIQGLGNPDFELIVKITNLSESDILPKLTITLDFDPDIYKANHYIQFSNKLFSNQSETFYYKISMNSDLQGVTDVVKCYFMIRGEREIIKQVSVEMPPAETLFF